MTDMLQITNLHKTFNPGTPNENHVLKGVSLTLKEGDYVTVIGGNGAGKSTLLNSIAGTIGVDSGEIRIDSVDVTRLPEHKRAGLLGRYQRTWHWLPGGESTGDCAGASPKGKTRSSPRRWKCWAWDWNAGWMIRSGCSPAVSARRSH